MHPILIKLGPITIHSYGFLIVAGFLVCLFFLRRKARALGYLPDQLTDLAFWGLVAGLFGARLFYILTQWRNFVDDPLAMLKFWEGGLVFYGGMLGGIAAFAYGARRFRIPIFEALDMAAPSLAIAHSFGRLGCFAAGCCFGRSLPEGHPLAVHFHNADSVAPLGVPLHPAQLYDAANTLIVFLVLEFIFVRRKFSGQVFAVYGMLYAVGRWIVETFRGDVIRGFVVDEVLSTSQFLSLLIFVTAAAVYLIRRKHLVPRPVK